MGRLATCKGCGKKLQPDEKFKFSNKTYCATCYEKLNRDGTAYRELIKFICDNYGLKEPTKMILGQIEKYKKNYGYHYAAMTYTLWYYKEILNKSFDEKYGVGLIKCFYDEAKEYYSQQERMKEKMEKLSDVEKKVKIAKTKITKNTKQSTSLINLENLLEGGD